MSLKLWISHYEGQTVKRSPQRAFDLAIRWSSWTWKHQCHCFSENEEISANIRKPIGSSLGDCSTIWLDAAIWIRKLGPDCHYDAHLISRTHFWYEDDFENLQVDSVEILWICPCGSSNSWIQEQNSFEDSDLSESLLWVTETNRPELTAKATGQQKSRLSSDWARCPKASSHFEKHQVDSSDQRSWSSGTPRSEHTAKQWALLNLCTNF